MEKKLNEKQNRIIIVGVIVIVFVVLIMFLFYFLHNKGFLGNSGVDKKVQLKGISKVDGLADRNTHVISDRRCTNDGKLCMQNISITYEITNEDSGKSRGVIAYTIVNSSESTFNKPLRIQLGNYKLVFYCGSLGPTGSCEGSACSCQGNFGFENFVFDFDDITDYTVNYSGEGDDQIIYDNFKDDQDALDSMIVDYSVD